MKIFAPAAVLVSATVLLTLSVVASVLAPPLELDSRDALVIAMGACGLVLLALTTRRFLHIHRALAR